MTQSVGRLGISYSGSNDLGPKYEPYSLKFEAVALLFASGEFEFVGHADQVN
jgi:hypothetical protein